MPRPVALVIALLAFGLVPFTGDAQDGTPAAGSQEFPLTPDPAECQAEAPSADDLIALWYQEDESGTPVLVTPEESGANVVPIHLGDPADAETIAGITGTIRAVIACMNAGDSARVLGYYSDDWIRSLGPSPGDTPEDVRNFLEASPEPRPDEERVRLLAVTDVAVGEDGRVAAFVIRDDPTTQPEGPNTALYYFEESDDGWLVNEVVEFGGADDGPTAIPENL